MFLYKTEEDNSIKVYELIPHKEEIKAYKKTELDAIPSDKRFMEHISLRNRLYSEDGILYVGQFNKLSRRSLIGIGCNDMFSYQAENERTNLLRDKFINGDYEGLDANKLYKLIGGAKEKNRLYFWVTEYYDAPYKKATLHNIMVLPRQLFILRALEEGRLDLLEGERLTEEMDLFDIKHVKDVNLDSMKELSSLGLIGEDLYSKTNREIHELSEYSEDILKFKMKSPLK